MQLKILLPYAVFTEQSAVRRIVVENQAGWIGLLPQRLDCIMALVPGILLYETQDQGEFSVAVDAGILVKTGREVLVSVRRAVSDKDLGQLRDLVKQEYLALDAQEKQVNQVMAKLESGFLRGFAQFEHA